MGDFYRFFTAVIIFHIYIISRAHGLLVQNDEEEVDETTPCLRPLMVHPPLLPLVTNGAKETLHYDAIDPNILIEMEELVGSIKNTHDLARVLALRFQGVKRELSKKDDLIKNITKLEFANNQLTAELSIYKFRSAIEVFEEKFCYLTCSELKKEAKTLLKSNPEETCLAKIWGKVKDHLARTHSNQIAAVAFADQIFCRELKWLWIFKNRSEEFEVRKILSILAGKNKTTENFAECIGMGYYFLSWQIHLAFLSKLPYPMMTMGLTPEPEVNDALTLFLDCYSFEGPHF